MVSFASLRPETEADKRLYLDGRLADVSCLDCRARVRARKNSERHTSIQWTDEALIQCSEFARRNSEPGGRVVHESCSRLMQSIERAYDDGQLRDG